MQKSKKIKEKSVSCNNNILQLIINYIHIDIIDLINYKLNWGKI